MLHNSLALSPALFFAVSPVLFVSLTRSLPPPTPPLSTLCISALCPMASAILLTPTTGLIDYSQVDHRVFGTNPSVNFGAKKSSSPPNQ